MMSLYDEFITRGDGLNHLLLSDTNKLLERIAKDFPNITKLTSIGQSFQGREINMLEIDVPNPDKKKKPAVLMTGATHAREMISTSLNIYQMMKLLMKGVVTK
jgi:carboxypeptidase T